MLNSNNNTEKPINDKVAQVIFHCFSDPNCLLWIIVLISKQSLQYHYC